MEFDKPGVVLPGVVDGVAGDDPDEDVNFWSTCDVLTSGAPSCSGSCTGWFCRKLKKDEDAIAISMVCLLKLQRIYATLIGHRQSAYRVNLDLMCLSE